MPYRETGQHNLVYIITFTGNLIPLETNIVLTQIAILAIVVIIGAVAAFFNVLNRETLGMLSKVIFNISLPLMLFTNFLKLNSTPELLANSFIVLSVSGLVIFFMLFIGWLTARAFRITGGEAAVFKAHSMFGNIIFLGFPLIYALYGAEGLLYASMFQLTSNIIMWTVGVVVLTFGNGVSWKKSIVKVINPNTIATIIGLIFFLLTIKLPKIIVTPLTETGAANTWLCMLYIGAMLASSDVGGLLKNKSLYIISFNRLIFVPAMLIALFALAASLLGVSPDKLVSSVIILEASMPCMASVVIMAKELGADDRLAVGNVFVSTVFSIVTLPIVLMAINRFL
jgi:malate permease and related proteins